MPPRDPSPGPDLHETAATSAARVARSEEIIDQTERQVSRSRTIIAETRATLARIGDVLKRGC